MRRIQVMTILFVLLIVNILALAEEYDKDGVITEKMLQSFAKNLASDENVTALQNAITGNSVRGLAYNRSKVGEVDKLFAHKIETSGITDQESSGRCWLFTSLNVMRPEVAETYKLDKFEFSQSYPFFFDQLEKANTFLEAVILTCDQDMDSQEVQWFFKSPIGDGGYWNMMPSVVEKYGLVPKEFMPETYHSSKTREMSQLVRRRLRAGGMEIRRLNESGKNIKALRKEKDEILSDVYRILCLTLGTPPTEFTWRYIPKGDSVITSKTYTPLSFYNEVVPKKLDEYVMFMDDPSKPYYKLYEISFSRNRFDSQNWLFLNIPGEELKPLAKKSILNDEPMYFSCDVGKQLDRKAGLVDINQYDYNALFGVDFGMDKKDRVLSFESGSSHGMTLVGVDTSSTGEPTKWLLENSWGSDSGFNGYLIMTDEWFDEYMFRLVILKQFLPENILKLLEQEPVLLKPWDRMS